MLPTLALAALTGLAALTTLTPASPRPVWGWPVAGTLGDPPPIERRFDPPAMRWDTGHRGIDLDAATGDAVHAVAAGTVVFAGEVGGKPVVSIDHANGLRSTYEPVTADVVAGVHVEPGEHIGILAADGGHCAGTCLHLGARRGADYINPLALLAPVVLKPLR